MVAVKTNTWGKRTKKLKKQVKTVDISGAQVYAICTMNLLGIGTDAKTSKGIALNVLTGILYLAPSNEAKVINTCPKASKGCRLSCLFTAGRGAFNSVKQARIAKTLRFVNEQEQFMSDLVADVTSLVKKATKLGMTPAVRLNGTSDVAWEKILVNGKSIMDLFPGVTFYDYTKRIERVRDFAAGKMPANYSLTFSKSENNDAEVAEAVSLGVNVAVVFSKPSFPSTYLGVPVISGDDTDVRFLDPKGVVVGLKAKGKAKRDTSGFVVVVK